MMHPSKNWARLILQCILCDILHLKMSYRAYDCQKKKKKKRKEMKDICLFFFMRSSLK